jgi:asparagine synthase (glutamine-hydrolysing)
MCGIAGSLIKKESGTIEAALGRMAIALSHRGPDDAGVQLIPVCDEAYSLGFAHCRLSIIDLSPAGHQPMQDPDTGNWIVYNGEIYNFQDVRRELEEQGERFRSQTDTEVILKAYARYGLECLHRFRGMFAFGLWDVRRQRLFLARDRLGIKPLYYCQSPDRLLFASEVRALLASGLVSRQLALAGLDSYLTLGAVQDPLTMIEHVYALEAGHYGIWQDGEFIVHTYWKLPTQVNEEWGHWPRRKIVDHLRELLEESIRLRLISDVPLGAFLSGGVDSSAITSLMTRALPMPLRTVSIVFPERKFSEGQYMCRIAQRFKTQHTEVVLTAKDMLEILPEALAAMDQPTFDGINTYIVSKHTRQAGLTVALSGIGGDELFGGYPGFLWAPRLERLREWMPGPVRSAVGTVVQQALRHNDRGRKLGRWFQNRDLDGGVYFLIRELFSPGDRRHLVPELNGDAGQPTRAVLDESASLDAWNRVSVLELSHYMRNVLLRDADNMSMAHALEVRLPLLDHRLVEFMLSLAGNVKVTGNQPKSLLVEAIGDLPPEIVSRRKRGFILPFSRWLRDQLKDNVETVLLDASGTGALIEVFDRTTVHDIWKRFLNGKGVWVRPWALYVVRQWCARHL